VLGFGFSSEIGTEDAKKERGRTGERGENRCKGKATADAQEKGGRRRQ
jgi:hypothetical protein